MRPEEANTQPAKQCISSKPPKVEWQDSNSIPWLQDHFSLKTGWDAFLSLAVEAHHP
jgi:hypothetical protein